MIDTLKASRKLKASGFSEEQAESIINVVVDTNEQTATKEDIRHLDKRFTILQWMTGLSLSGVIAILVVLAF